MLFYRKNAVEFHKRNVFMNKCFHFATKGMQNRRDKENRAHINGMIFACYYN